MFEKYTKKEIENENIFNTIYEYITNKGLRLVASQTRLTKETIAVANSVITSIFDNSKYHIILQNYMNLNANKTKTYFKFIVEVLFSNCNYFAVVDNDLFIKSIDNYSKKYNGGNNE